MLALVTTIALASAGWLALQVIRAGWDYASARGNPRNRAQAHETLWDVGKGAALIAGAAAIAALAVKTLVFA